MSILPTLLLLLLLLVCFAGIVIQDLNTQLLDRNQLNYRTFVHKRTKFTQLTRSYNIQGLGRRDAIYAPNYLTLYIFRFMCLRGVIYAGYHFMLLFRDAPLDVIYSGTIFLLVQLQAHCTTRRNLRSLPLYVVVFRAAQQYLTYTGAILCCNVAGSCTARRNLRRCYLALYCET